MGKITPLDFEAGGMDISEILPAFIVNTRIRCHCPSGVGVIQFLEASTQNTLIVDQDDVLMADYDVFSAGALQKPSN
jgi:hypothetical protein